MNRIVVSDITDPYINLAIENELLLGVKPGQRILFLYTNDPCVVIGRFQNPWIECNLKKMSLESILFVRRQSGGGTVYQDNNNTNFSFIADRKLHSQKYNHELVLNALKHLDVDAYATERGDIKLSDGTDRKISGSAFKQKKDQAFHHGTMLIDSNLEKLNLYISSNKQDLQTKSIASVRSKVANISEINASIDIEKLHHALIDQFKIDSGSIELKMISNNDITKEMNEYVEVLKSHAWKILSTPKFFHKIISAGFEMELEINKAKIISLSISSDKINPIVTNEIENLLLNSTLELNSMNKLKTKKDLLEEDVTIRIIDQLIEEFDLVAIASL